MNAAIIFLTFSVREPVTHFLSDVQAHVTTNLGSFNLHSLPVCKESSSYRVECHLRGEWNICEHLRATMTDSLTLSQVFDFHVDDAEVRCDRLPPIHMKRYREWLRAEDTSIEWLQAQHR